MCAAIVVHEKEDRAVSAGHIPLMLRVLATDVAGNIGAIATQRGGNGGVDQPASDDTSTAASTAQPTPAGRCTRST
jgi:hypothetical protein